MYEVTLKDIAEKVGCSINTVSLALKDSPRISEATRRRVKEVASDLNYASNNMARALVLKKTGTIGLILRNISSLLLTTEARYIEQYLRDCQSRRLKDGGEGDQPYALQQGRRFDCEYTVYRQSFQA